MHEDDLSRAVLYCWPTSFLSTVPRFCLLEKGYADDEYDVNHVDITTGENFSPRYLKINRHATIPTLLVPHAESPSAGSSRQPYHVLDDTTSICHFVDVSRPARTPPSGQRKSAPILSPMTATDRSLSGALIRLVRSPVVDPNFLELAARDHSELRAKLRGAQGAMLYARQQALGRYRKEVADEAAALRSSGAEEHAAAVEVVQTLEGKAAANQALLDIYNNNADEGRQMEYFDASRAAWTIHLPSTLAKLEVAMIGPFALGDDLAIADCHVIAWLARIIAICGGGPVPQGITSIEPYMGGIRVGSKLQIYWGHWVQRTSFRKLAGTLFNT